MHISQHNQLPNLEGGQTRQYAAGEVIYHPESGVNCCFIVQTGQARIFLNNDNRELTIGYLKPNSLYVTHTRAWIAAMTTTQLTSWPIQHIQTLLRSQPELAIAAMQEIGTFLHNTLDIIEDLAFRSVESRLARYLLLEYEQQQDLTIQLSGNTEILASLLGTSRQTLSTLLNQMLKTGVIARVDRQRLTLINLAYLKQIAE